MAVPADHSATIENLGKLKTARLMWDAALGYRRTIAYLLRQGRYKDLYSFLYTKTLVPTGEGSGELAYYFIGGLLQQFPSLAPYPRFIEVEVTSRCNKQCVICEHTWWKEPAKDLSYAEFSYLTDQFPLRWVNLTGEGDAFLNQDYLLMIERLKRRGVSVYLVDSFDLIDFRIATKLVGLGVDGIYISMDGATKEVYESIKIGCDFNKVIDNIQTLVELKRLFNSPIPELCFRFVVNKWNVWEMMPYIQLINSLGSRYDLGDGSKIHFVGLLDFPEVHNLYLDELPDGLKQLVTSVNSNIPIVFAHTENSTNPSMNRCLAWMEPYFALVPHNMVLPCCAVLMSNSRAKLAEYSFGDYLQEPMKKIWSHPYYKWFRKTVTNPKAPVPQLCQGCRAYDTTLRELAYGVDKRKREDFE